jgi:Reverse transcriptase (RNA-dependent DNA polymerase)
VSPLLANIYLARLDRVLEAEGVSFVRYADDVRLSSRTPSGARQALTRIAEVLQGLGLRLSERKTKLVTAYQGVDFLGYRLVVQKGHLNVYVTPKALERFREEVRRLTRRTAGLSLRAVVSRLDRYLRGCGGVFQARTGGRGVRPVRSLDSATPPRVCGKAVAQRTLATLPDRYFWAHLNLTRLYRLRQDFLRELAARRGAGNRPVERSAGDPHATFVRGTEASS